LASPGRAKSTLGRILLGLLPPTSGEVLYIGNPIRQLRGDEWKQFRREVQVVFQDTSTSLNPRKTIGVSLDVSVRAQVLKLLRDLQRDANLAELFITHDLGVVRAVASRVRVMYLRALVESGPVEALFTAPATRTPARCWPQRRCLIRRAATGTARSAARFRRR